MPRTNTRLHRKAKLFAALAAVVLAGLAVFFAARFLGRTPGFTAQPLPSGEEVHILFATDLHYMPHELLDEESKLYQELMSGGGDGKLVHYSPEITDAFIDEVIRQKPHALILGGDLSFNGEKASHRELAEKLSAVNEAGIPVLVIPGNHDINRPSSYHYTKSGAVKTAGLTEKEFWALYSPLGASGAASLDPASLSYLYPVAEDFYVMMLDTSRYTADDWAEGGRLRPETLAWIEEELQKAEAAGATVITVTHHNLLVHSVMFYQGYTIDGHKEAAGLLSSYGVELNLSGHMHIQHIEDGYGLYDIATNAMSVYPNHYARLDIGARRSIAYSTASVDVEKWANEVGSTNPDLLGFAAYARAYMDNSSARQAGRRSEEYDWLSEENKADMISFVQRLNADYFSGIAVQNAYSDPGYALWAEIDDEFFMKYIHMILAEKGESRELFIGDN